VTVHTLNHPATAAPANFLAFSGASINNQPQKKTNNKMFK